MYEKMAYCGLFCDGCPVLLATREKDKTKQRKMRAEILRISNEQYGLNFKPEDITDCDGCKSESNRLLTASRQCGIRKCASQKGLQNCAYCEDYACDILQKFHKTDPDAKARLDILRSAL